MNLDKLYSIAEKENIPVINFKMKNKAIIGKIDKDYCIGLNYSKIDNSREEKELLAEELGHYYCDCFYTIDTDETILRKKEYRTKKWMFTTLASASKIITLKEKGVKYCYEIAEELNISEELARQACQYYQENNYI